MSRGNWRVLCRIDSLIFHRNPYSSIEIHTFQQDAHCYSLHIKRQRLEGILSRPFPKSSRIHFIVGHLLFMVCPYTIVWLTLIWWTRYNLIKSFLSERQTPQLSPTQHLLAAAEAGTLTVLMTNPIWLVKTRMCVQDSTKADAYRGLFGSFFTCRNLIKHERRIKAHCSPGWL